MEVPLDFLNGPGYVALSWEVNESGRDADFDLSCVCLDGTGAVVDAAYFKRRNIFGGMILHSGDARAGVWEGDDEACTLHVPSLPPTIMFIVVTVTKNKIGLNDSDCAVRVCDGGQPNGRIVETLKFTKEHKDSSAFVFGCMRRVATSWIWNPIHKQGNGNSFHSAISMADDYLAHFIDPSILACRPIFKERFDLNKNDVYDLDPAIEKISMGLGWDTYCDVDAHCHAFDEDLKEMFHVYFGKLSVNGVTHSGDNLTGDGSGDDEAIEINFEKLSPSVKYLAFSVVVFSGASDFSLVKGCYARMFIKGGLELCKMTLDNKDASFGKTALMCIMSKTEKNAWKLEATCETTNHSIQTALGVLQGKSWKCRLTPLRARIYQPSGLKGVLTLVKGEYLAAKDLNGKSDPYVKIKGDHGGQANTKKTDVKKKTVNPVWNETFEFLLPREDSYLKFNIYDHDRIGDDDPMGRVKIDSSLLQQYLKSGAQEFTLDVFPQDNERCCGKLIFKILTLTTLDYKFEVRQNTRRISDAVVGVDSVNFKATATSFSNLDFIDNELKVALYSSPSSTNDFHLCGQVSLDGKLMYREAGNGPREVSLSLDENKGEISFSYQIDIDRSLH